VGSASAAHDGAIPCLRPERPRRGTRWVPRRARRAYETPEAAARHHRQPHRRAAGIHRPPAASPPATRGNDARSISSDSILTLHSLDGQDGPKLPGAPIKGRRLVFLVVGQRGSSAPGADDYLTKPSPLNEKFLARGGVSVFVSSASQQIEAKNKELERLALTDALTGLPNRRAIEDWGTREVSGATDMIILSGLLSPIWTALSRSTNLRTQRLG